jgi:hypothetical protein
MISPISMFKLQHPTHNLREVLAHVASFPNGAANGRGSSTAAAAKVEAVGQFPRPDNHDPPTCQFGWRWVDFDAVN